MGKVIIKFVTPENCGVSPTIMGFKFSVQQT